MATTVNADDCTACGICIDDCPNGCFDCGDTAIMARPEDCTECGICVDACPTGALSL
ncbi:MAG: 4Fe-4S binding protein [Actinomycetia bacterium]|nr:4Fe-4S binding protein [Actinomycetes bacterium]